jgi:GTPase SAR1 family protein
MDEHILTTLKIVIIGETGVGKSRLVLVQFHFIYVWALEVIFGRTSGY